MDAAGLLRAVGPLGLAITTKDILNLDSSNIQAEEWEIIARHIHEDSPGYDGVVVTHGTDTMAYTASMMTFMLRGLKIPVVFTGSQLPVTHPLTDAIDNLRCAVAMALTGLPGIFVAFDRQVILGCRAVKVRTSSLDAFESVNYPPIGQVTAQGLQLHPERLREDADDTALRFEIERRVYLIKLTPTTPPELFGALKALGCRGVILEAFGLGGLQFIRRDIITALGDLVGEGVVVAVCSQCLYEPSSLDSYEVGVRARRMGVLSAGDMTSEAAYTKLMWILGQTDDPEEAARMFLGNMAGEIMDT